MLTCQNEIGQFDTAKQIVIVDDQSVPDKPVPQPPDPVQPPITPTDPPAVPTPPTEAIVVTETGEEVAVTQVDDTVDQGTPLTLASNTVTKESIVENIAKVEFYVDGKLVQTIYEPPFIMNTDDLKPGTYTITEKIYFKDGATTTRSQVVTIVNPMNGWAFFAGLVVIAALGCWVWARHFSKQ